MLFIVPYFDPSTVTSIVSDMIAFHPDWIICNLQYIILLLKDKLIASAYMVICFSNYFNFMPIWFNLVAISYLGKARPAVFVRCCMHVFSVSFTYF